jgi:hypothetical protein
MHAASIATKVVSLNCQLKWWWLKVIFYIKTSFTLSSYILLSFEKVKKGNNSFKHYQILLLRVRVMVFSRRKLEYTENTIDLTSSHNAVSSTPPPMSGIQTYNFVDHHCWSFHFTMHLMFIGLLFVFSDLLTNVGVYKTFQHDSLNGLILPI